MLRCLEASRAAGREAVLRASSARVDRVLQLSGMDAAFRREPADQARADPR
jgi:anti-anti-sigma regulatory factor